MKFRTQFFLATHSIQKSSAASLLLLLSVTSAAQAQTHPFVFGSDPRPVVRSGSIGTDAYDDLTGNLITDVRHFGYTLGRSPGNPFFTSDPGFNAVVGSGLPAGQQLRFDATRQLAYWNGSGVPSFNNVPAGESLELRFGAAIATVTGTSTLVPGFSIGNIASGGSIHRHLNAFLVGSASPTPGIYFTALRLATSGTSVSPSEAIYIAYGNQIPQADFARGLSYIANPLPGDANFDGRVDFSDLVILAVNYNRTTGSEWFDGDFNRDRAVNFNDLVSLAVNYNTATVVQIGTVGFTQAFIADWNRATALVPEPASVAFGVVGGLVLLQRRKSTTSSSR